MEKKKNIANDLFFASVEEFLKEGRSVEMTVKGFSMRPFVRNERDVVVLAPVEGVTLRRGMVVLFRHNGHHTLHRFVGESDGVLTMVGDGNYRQRELVRREDVVAYVTQVRLEGGRRLSYGSLGWRCRTMGSLARKWVRTVAIDLKYKILG